MIDLGITIISWVLLISGCFLCISGGIGILRFPDVFTRMHAASVTDTLGGGLILAGLIFQANLEWLVIGQTINDYCFYLANQPYF